MDNSKPVPTRVATGTKLSKDDEGADVNPTLFKRLVGNLMYLTATRPDIMQGVSLISRFMEIPKKNILDCWKKNSEIHSRNQILWHNVCKYRK